ncbi:MAG: M23 family metallopeptidase [Alcanivoracaceae bacterium]
MTKKPAIVLINALLVAALVWWHQSTSPSCTQTPYSLLLPLGGEYGVDWTISNYVDLSGGGPPLDWGGHQVTYRGHEGVDFVVPHFGYMDDGFPVLAVADGVVEGVVSHHSDRQTQRASRQWNVVTVKHDNGYTSVYGHLRKQSSQVRPGQRVHAGESLGVIGSSGDSDWPHLHFELRDCRQGVVDPSREGLWSQMPPYVSPLLLMDARLFPYPGNEAAVRKQLLDYPEPPVLIAATQPLTFALVLSGGQPGNTASVRLRRQDGSIARENLYRFENTHGFSWRYWWWDLKGESGTLTAEALINGVVHYRHSLKVD